MYYHHTNATAFADARAFELRETARGRTRPIGTPLTANQTLATRPTISRAVTGRTKVFVFALVSAAIAVGAIAIASDASAAVAPACPSGSTGHTRTCESHGSQP
jgi:hypothetical protein